MALNHSPSIVRNGLILYLDAANSKSYPGSGTTWTDLSGNGNTGALTNGPTFNSANNGSIVFNGSNNYVDTTALLFESNQFSLSFWVNVSSFSGWCSGAVGTSLYTIFGTTGSYRGYTNTFSTCIQIGANSSAIGTLATSGFLTNRWYYYSTVYDGTQIGNSQRLKLWIDNAQYTLTFDATVPSSPYKANLTAKLGRGVTASLSLYPYFTGKISCVKYYNRALSATEISQNFNATRGRYGI